MTLMKIKGVLDECFQDYKKISMLISTNSCDWKCCNEAGISVAVCQNNELAKQDDYDISIDSLIKRYLGNPITEAIIFAGLEPMLQLNDILTFIYELRHNYQCEDDIVIYTGYYPNEIDQQLEKLKQFKNIIVKFGRYIPDKSTRYDDILGVNLISNNQFAIKIS